MRTLGLLRFSDCSDEANCGTTAGGEFMKSSSCAAADLSHGLEARLEAERCDDAIAVDGPTRMHVARIVVLSGQVGVCGDDLIAMKRHRLLSCLSG